MLHREFRTLACSLGFEVIAFDALPKICGSWGASVQRQSIAYDIVSDRHEACFGIWRQQAQQPSLVFGVHLQTLSDTLEREMLHTWLTQLACDS